MDLKATRHSAEDREALDAVLALLQRGFAGMTGRIDPPSSVGRLSLEDLAQHCEHDEVWSLGPPPVACMILAAKPDHLYLSKLCVAPELQGQGLGRQLIDLAAARARDLGLPSLALQTRVELVENHVAFTRMGFAEIGRTNHPGFDRPTSITFGRVLI